MRSSNNRAGWGVRRLRQSTGARTFPSRTSTSGALITNTRALHLIAAWLTFAALSGGELASSRVPAGVRHPQPSGPLSLHACHIASANLDGKCGTYEVFEDRQAGRGRKIALNIIVVPATNPVPLRDPVFWLHGGPGAAATDMVSAVRAAFLSVLHPDRDLVFVDQRGTGQSNGLKCPFGDDPADLKSFFGDLPSREVVRRCRAALEKVANLALYTTSNAMDDLDDVRAALGYDKINLVGASYGSIAAQEYMRRHGDHTRAVFLGGVATTGMKLPLPLAQGAQHALDRLFEDCGADDLCRRTFPNLRAEFDAVLRRFDSGPVNVELINPVTKQRETVRIARANYIERVRTLLYTTTFARYVPLVVHSAYRHDFVPLESMAIVNNLGSLLSRGVHLTITCSENVAFITEPEIAQATAGTFMGQERVRAQIEQCAEWPKANVPAAFLDPVRSTVPVLMMSGEVDGSTAPWLGEEAVKYMPNGRQVKIRYSGHQLDSPCVWGIMHRFIDQASVERLDTSCTAGIRRPPFATEIPAGYGLR